MAGLSSGFETCACLTRYNRIPLGQLPTKRVDTSLQYPKNRIWRSHKGLQTPADIQSLPALKIFEKKD